MRITEVRDLTVPLVGGVANAVVSFADHTVSLVALVSDQRRQGRPVIGFGFNSIGRFGQSGILRERLFPRLLAADPDSLLAPGGEGFDAAAVAAAVMRNEKPGGHGDRAGAVAAVELAVWDLNAKLAGEPACRTIARRFGRRAPHADVAVYAAGGYYYPDDSTARLGDELRGYAARGFEAFKIKIGGAPLDVDLDRIDAALDVAGDGSALAVDANGRFDEDQALRYAEALEGYGLRWYEEPGDPLDFDLNRSIAKTYRGAVATGENLFSAADARNLVRYGGMRPGLDVLQMDPGLSYGITEYGRMLSVLEQAGFHRGQCLPHGGHLINLHVVAGLGLGGCEAYPGVFQPFGGYSPACRIDGGRVTVPEDPGFGLEQKPELAPFLDRLGET
ncbi:MAG: mandelate racemase [Gammaproteobacteria bacterium]|nr:mandelate racemase [Gammaproteobacteria bacterium]|tara:strand:+ start:519 stop:1688 length:1170 start_codon:yes stop_codon:yes gene_type:complete